MVGFMQIPEWFGDALVEGEQYLVGGGDESSMLIREASAQVSTYSARLKRDFSQFNFLDSPEINEYVKILLGDTSLEFSLPTIYIGAGIVAPNSTRPLVEAYDFGNMPAQGTMWYVGARSFMPTECDWARHTQRLLPGFEVDIDTALRTALADLDGQAYRLMINLDILDPAWANAVKRPVGLGITPLELFKALQIIEGTPVELLQICGLDHRHNSPHDTARLGAEIARDAALLAWGN